MIMEPPNQVKEKIVGPKSQVWGILYYQNKTVYLPARLVIASQKKIKKRKNFKFIVQSSSWIQSNPRHRSMYHFLWVFYNRLLVQNAYWDWGRKPGKSQSSSCHKFSWTGLGSHVLEEGEPSTLNHVLYTHRVADRWWGKRMCGLP